MRALAQRAIDEHLTDEEIKRMNQQVKDLGEQVKLLDCEATQRS